MRETQPCPLLTLWTTRLDALSIKLKSPITASSRQKRILLHGRHPAIIDTPAARIGVLICYDVEFPEAVRYLADEGVEILFVPFCTDNRQG